MKQGVRDPNGSQTLGVVVFPISGRRTSAFVPFTSLGWRSASRVGAKLNSACLFGADMTMLKAFRDDATACSSAISRR